MSFDEVIDLVRGSAALTVRKLIDETAQVPEIRLSSELEMVVSSVALHGVLPWRSGILQLSFGDLDAAQIGYAVDQDARPLHHWNDRWVVVAHQDGNPFAVDIEEFGSPVFLMMHGSGTWDPTPFTESLADFLIFVEGWAQLVDAYPDGITGDGFNLLPLFRDAFEKMIAPLLLPEGKQRIFELIE